MTAEGSSPADGARDALVADRALLGRTSTVERVATVLRSRVIDGYFPPGTRLSEDSIGSALGVSRNTLREAFRLLTHERLLVHELNRGMFVRRLTAQDVVDLYRVRRLVECSAVREAHEPPLEAVAEAVEDGRRALEAQDWQGLGTANMRFHQALAALAGSPRVDELMRGVLAELRLVFDVMADPRRFHEPYLARNAELLATLQDGDGLAAEKALAEYLGDAERQLLAAFDA